MGRPTNDPKIHELKIRMSDSYMKKLEYCQNQTGKTRAEIIRDGVDEVYQKLKK